MTFRVDSYNMTLALIDHDLVILINGPGVSNALYASTFVKLCRRVIYLSSRLYSSDYEINICELYRDIVNQISYLYKVV